MATEAERGFICGLLLNGFLALFGPPPVTTELQSTQLLDTRQLFPYKAYKDVQIFHYTVPTQVSLASWEFQSNGSQHCPLLPVHVYLQFGSYPVIDVRNMTSHLQLMPPRQPMYHVSLCTDLQPSGVNVSSPTPGDWFAVAFFYDKAERIVQKGLYIPCQAWLSSSVKFHMTPSVIDLLPGDPMPQQISEAQYYKFFVPKRVWSARVKLSNCAGVPFFTDIPCPVLLAVQPKTLPVGSTTLGSYVDCSTVRANRECSLEFIPSENDWSYVLVDMQQGSKMEFVITVEIVECKINHHQSPYFTNGFVSTPSKSKKPSKKATLYNPLATPFPPPFVFTTSTEAPFQLWHPRQVASLSCWPQVSLVRKKLPGNFAFQYIPYVEGSNISSLPAAFNISTWGPTLTSFTIYPLVDIGGTLAVEVALPPSINTSFSNVSLTACLQYSVRPTISANGSCLSGTELSINTSTPKSCLGTLLVPYPEAGEWYLSFQPRCYFQEREGNESEVVDVQCESNTTTILLRIESGPCVVGQCGDFGRCYRYLSGGFIFSTCVCTAGWQGWGCADDSNALSEAQLLLSLLLLTLSNILFLPVIILAAYRRYFTESFIYLATMVFSVLYHACDVEVSSFCVMRLSVLQFCDFYCTILAFWVTLIAMAHLPSSVQSIAHMAGAVGVSLGVEYDRTGLWVFVVPAGIGVIILIISWIHHCFHKRGCFPRKRIWLLLLPGVAFTAGGLLLFAFLETEKNYVYVHSGWHACIALAVVFLLPERRPSKDSAQEVMQVNWKPHGSFKFLQDNETDML